jgi:hypothetical protein
MCRLNTITVHFVKKGWIFAGRFHLVFITVYFPGAPSFSLSYLFVTHGLTPGAFVTRLEAGSQRASQPRALV